MTIYSTRKKMREWAESKDAEVLRAEYNGQQRGDGYDCTIYRSEKTRRFIVEVYYVASGLSSFYLSKSLDGALDCIKSGYTPGHAPGNYRLISGNIAELRTTDRK